LNSDIENLRNRVNKLQERINLLEKEKEDLELMLKMNADHGDEISNDLLSEVVDLQQKINNLENSQTDLELMLEMNAEHTDAIEDELLQKIDYNLRENEKRFRLISETIPIPVFLCENESLKIIYANQSAASLLLVTITELLSMTLKDFIFFDESGLSFDVFNIKRTINDLPVNGKKTDGVYFYASLYKKEINISSQNLSLIVLHDNTNQKMIMKELADVNEVMEKKIAERTKELQESLKNLKYTQDSLIKSEHLAELGRLVAGVAHEVNTPIGNSITVFSFLQQKTIEFEILFTNEKLTKNELTSYIEAAKESVEILGMNLVRASELIKSFKMIAVDQNAELKRNFNIKEYIGNILLSLQPKLNNTKHNIILDCPDNLVIYSYPGSFSQVMTNLITNTLLHAFDGIEAGTIKIKCMREEDKLLLIYSDNGVGIEKETLPKIFDPFFTTKRSKGGSGLGLSVVYNIVTQKLNGKITCESVPGELTTFTVTIKPMFVEE
jgi:signal transduction histidine kinase